MCVYIYIYIYIHKAGAPARQSCSGPPAKYTMSFILIKHIYIYIYTYI